MSAIIIGGSITGWTCASALRAGGDVRPITIIESEPMPYDRPPLSKAAFVEGAALDTIAFGSPADWAAASLDVICGHQATAIDPVAMTVTLDDGRVLAADDLVLATGASARRPTWPGADDPRVRVLRDYADAAELRDGARPGTRVAVLGGGLIGAEITSGLRALGVEVTLVDRNPVPIVPLVGPTMAGHLHDLHRAHGVDVRIGEVVAVRAARDSLEVELTDGSTFTAAEVLVGIGAEPRTELADAAGLEVDAGILVDRDGRTSAPRIYAGGDAARHRGPDGALSAPGGHWEAGQLDGRAIAAAILGGPAAPERGAPWFWSDRYGLHLEVVGRFAGPGRELVRSGGAHPATFWVDDGLLVGAASIDDANTVRAARRLIDQRIPVAPTDLENPGVTLRSLLTLDPARSAAPGSEGPPGRN